MLSNVVTSRIIRLKRLHTRKHHSSEQALKERGEVNHVYVCMGRNTSDTKRTCELYDKLYALAKCIMLGTNQHILIDLFFYLLISHIR